MYHKSFIANVYNAAHTITRMKCRTGSWIIFDCAMIITMFNILEDEEIKVYLNIYILLDLIVTGVLIFYIFFQHFFFSKYIKTFFFAYPCISLFYKFWGKSVILMVFLFFYLHVYWNLGETRFDGSVFVEYLAIRVG